MSLKKKELINFISYFFLKNLNMNLFMCLHLGTNSSHVLCSDLGSAFMIFQLHIDHISSITYLLVGFASYRPLKVIMHAAIFEVTDRFREFCTFFFTFVSNRIGMVVVMFFEFFFASTIPLQFPVTLKLDF